MRAAHVSLPSLLNPSDSFLIGVNFAKVVDYHCTLSKDYEVHVPAPIPAVAAV